MPNFTTDEIISVIDVFVGQASLNHILCQMRFKLIVDHYAKLKSSRKRRQHLSCIQDGLGFIESESLINLS